MRYDLKGLILLVFLMTALSSKSQKNNEIHALFYNVENLFDCKDDSLTRDEEFTPNGDKEWTETKLWSKVNTLAKVIRGMDSTLPDIIGLAEIENASVLQSIVDHPLLSSKKYKIIHFESPDLRGIDVALLYAAEAFNPYFFLNFDVNLAPRPTRDILVVEGTVESGDSVRFLVNHWPSRYGGKKRSMPKRVQAANRLKSIADSLQSIRTVPFQIAMGDFNDENSDSSLQILSGSDWKYMEPQNYTSDVRGTYKYRSAWGQYDAFLIYSGKQYQSEMKIALNDWLFVEDKKYGGLKINRSFFGDFFNGGPSDHLPIRLALKW